LKAFAGRRMNELPYRPDNPVSQMTQ